MMKATFYFCILQPKSHSMNFPGNIFISHNEIHQYDIIINLRYLILLKRSDGVWCASRIDLNDC